MYQFVHIILLHLLKYGQFHTLTVIDRCEKFSSSLKNTKRVK